MEDNSRITTGSNAYIARTPVGTKMMRVGETRDSALRDAEWQS
jgi:hypothetical protein